MNDDSKPERLNEQRTERVALQFSVAGMGVMAAAGVGFAVISHSDAILLDGVFSTVGLIMALLTLKVAELVRRPDDEQFHFGYAQFTPLLNFAKALLMLVMCLFAAASAVDSFISGGRELELGLAVVYGVVATVACVAAAIALRIAARRTGSELVQVDSVTWVVDSMISGAVLLGFLLGFLLRGTAYEPWLRYLDPAIVVLLVVISLPEPARILWSSLRESLLFAPSRHYQERVRKRLAGVLSRYAQADYRVRLLKLGNSVTILVHLRPLDEFKPPDVAALDQVHSEATAALADLPERIFLDLVWVGDMALSD